MNLRAIFKIGYLPLSSMLGLLLFVLVAGGLYLSLEQDNNEQRSKKMADTLVQYFKSEIHHGASVLGVVGKQFGVFNQNSFDRVAKSIVDEYPHFYSINFVDTSGVIRRVYPNAPNILALGKKLSDRTDVSNYLKASQAEGLPFMSHRLFTYQGIPAYTLYVPLQLEDGKFIGWLNAVVDFDSWLGSTVKLLGIEGTGISVSWDHPESEPLKFGADEIDRPFSYSYQVLNQNLKFQIGFEGDLNRFEGRRNFLILIFTGVVLILIGFFLIVRISSSEQRLSEVNANLKLKQGLLSALTHDISSPLTTLGFIFELSTEQNQALSEQDKIRIQKCLTSIEEMLMATKLLHLKGSAHIQQMLRPVKISEVLNEAVSLVGDHLEGKEIKVEVMSHSKDISVLAEARTLCNNVLVNLLTNSIKFSASRSTIIVSIEARADKVQIKIEDEGTGWSLEQLNRFRGKQPLDSTLGTDGEQGSGLGMFQVQSFMELYGGAVQIENRVSKGSSVKLIFRAAGAS